MGQAKRTHQRFMVVFFDGCANASPILHDYHIMTLFKSRWVLSFKTQPNLMYRNFKLLFLPLDGGG